MRTLLYYFPPIPVLILLFALSYSIVVGVYRWLR